MEASGANQVQDMSTAVGGEIDMLGVVETV